MRDEMTVLCKKIDTCLPHSFVLADLFEVESMTLDIPDHVYEDDPLLEWVVCPCCEGEKWLEVEGNGWLYPLWCAVCVLSG
jgi:hypothetical protein